ncbi:PAS domain S-box protein [Brevundimonas denitrificans]|uniref:PAS domain S-box protein n=1 Tax=Brevundimonas denitrificans TaxID=1443434 RepID=UPI00223B3FCC|nr:PAS domain S-box protein [Brevundimonas denitrificans]
MIVTDGELRILVFSGGAETIFGYAANEIIGRSIEVLIPEGYRVRHREHVARFKQNAATSLRMRGRLQTMGVSKSGATIPIEVDLSRLTAPRARSSRRSSGMSPSAPRRNVRLPPLRTAPRRQSGQERLPGRHGA